MPARANMEQRSRNQIEQDGVDVTHTDIVFILIYIRICPIAHNNFLIDTCLVAILYFFLFMFSFFVQFHFIGRLLSYVPAIRYSASVLCIVPIYNFRFRICKWTFLLIFVVDNLRVCPWKLRHTHKFEEKQKLLTDVKTTYTYTCVPLQSNHIYSAY